MQGVFNFQGTSSMPSVSRQLFPPTEPKIRKPVIIKKKLFDQEFEASKESDHALATLDDIEKVNDNAIVGLHLCLPAADIISVKDKPEMQKEKTIDTNPTLELGVVDQPLQICGTNMIAEPDDMEDLQIACLFEEANMLAAEGTKKRPSQKNSFSLQASNSSAQNIYSNRLLKMFRLKN